MDQKQLFLAICATVAGVMFIAFVGFSGGGAGSDAGSQVGFAAHDPDASFTDRCFATLQNHGASLIRATVRNDDGPSSTSERKRACGCVAEQLSYATTPGTIALLGDLFELKVARKEDSRAAQTAVAERYRLSVADLGGHDAALSAAVAECTGVHGARAEQVKSGPQNTVRRTGSGRPPGVNEATGITPRF